HLLVTSGEVPYFEGILLKNSPWTADEVARVSQFLEGRPLQNGRKFVWNPLAPELSDPLFRRVLGTPSTELEQFYYDLGVRLSPPTDDRPFIEHFLLFGNDPVSPELPEEFRFRNSQKWRGWIPRGDFPYLAILAESALLSLVFIAAPLLIFARKKATHPSFKGLLAYFASLGFGFIVVEICLMKRYVLFLGNPAYSITTVLVVLLCGAGIGSICSGRLYPKAPGKAAAVAIPLVALAALSEAFLSPLVFQAFLAQEFPVRIAIASVLLLPLGIVMGLPFPIGLRLIAAFSPDERETRRMTAWAWGMNGYFTVIGSAATVFIAVFAGFTAALWIALGTYLIGLFSVRRLVTASA
ncbi:MAG: hypothetical protein KDD69_01860, partial [Bdellovibrionales bacterium]|nr:hypothetical protein [Bdellovibrionales bacterium]